MKNIILFSFLFTLFNTINGTSQSIIPNGSFDNWVVTDNGGPSYNYPENWTESYVYLLNRLSYGTGFFDKYSESDANGNALSLRRAYSNKGVGFTRFECDDIPSKLKGRYKFSGSDNVTETDTLVVAINFSHISDTLTLAELHGGKYHKNTVFFKTTMPQSEFTNFEIDLTSYSSSQEYDYIAIQFMIYAGRYLNKSVATGVIDDLEFEYNSLSVDKNPLLDNNNILIYPNPTPDYIKIESEANITKVKIFDTNGKLIISQKETKKIDISALPKGIYILNIYSKNNLIDTKRILKE